MGAEEERPTLERGDAVLAQWYWSLRAIVQPKSGSKVVWWWRPPANSQPQSAQVRPGLPHLTPVEQDSDVRAKATGMLPHAQAGQQPQSHEWLAKNKPQPDR